MYDPRAVAEIRERVASRLRVLGLSATAMPTIDLSRLIAGAIVETVNEAYVRPLRKHLNATPTTKRATTRERMR